MIASDIPQGYSTPDRMARSLSTYLDDPREVRRRVMDIFGTCPCTSEIRRYRQMHLRIEYTEPFKPHEGYYPDAERKKAKAASDLFLARILHERGCSRFQQATPGEREQALRSTYLTEPALVDKAWERSSR